ncbi:hypothetical protein M4I33_00605 [Clostridium sp. LY3-2]|uniref:hypothetical protein n=1 Tax=Clostridium sp. LY3-2 TaxID=2942482 RepID=UPI002152BE8A|nr:hypothetical protein [Clostridium sp. LY3-2]MCR6513377.1 hypothetical protein [Clostridium sp. LY3-2]
MDNLIMLEDVFSKRNELNELKKRYIDLFEKKEALLTKEKVFLENLYIRKFGELLKERLETSIRYERLKKILEYSLESEGDLKNIDEIIADDLEDYYIDLERFKEKKLQSEGSNKLLITTDEEIEKVSELFKHIALKISPEIHETEEKERRLWKISKTAYKENDIMTLFFIKDVIADVNVDKEERVKELNSKIEELKIRIFELQNSIYYIKTEFPFDIKDEIEDIFYIQKTKDTLKKDISEMKIHIENMNKELNGRLNIDL